MKKFVLNSDYKPAGDQGKAIDELVTSINKGNRYQTLKGATGTGKTFTIANVIEKIQKPTIVLAHNKTLAAQLCSEFQDFFPDNAVSYFVSYYDYYQPEAYLPASDTYIQKDASINDEINSHRHAATVNLLTRKDVLIVATVSCIYGLGSVEDYESLAFDIKVGEERKRDKLLRRLSDMQYVRSRLEFKQGMFHVLGDVLEIYPPSQDTVYTIEFFGDEIEKIYESDPFTGEILQELESITIYPSKHNVTTKEKIVQAVDLIRQDLEIRYTQLQSMGKMLEAERLKTKTEYDLEIMLETGYCSGIENYTKYLNNREDGMHPSTLLDYMPDDFLMVIDESHITVPQFGAMYAGNRSRKDTLVLHGFRLPSAQDNRPLMFSEFESHMKQVAFVSATPGKYEYEKTPDNLMIEQVIRPTGLLDPEVEVRPLKAQIANVLKEARKVIKKGERVLITTLTKKSAEALTEYFAENAMKVKYLHSDIDTIERIEILRELREGKIDIVVGINLLREGLDLPEVSLIGVLDADKQGFLRSKTALIQIIGRAARNLNGRVIMYADKMTDAMIAAIDETERRREIQIAHNRKYGITPKSIIKAIKDIAQHGKKDNKNAVKHYEKVDVPEEERQRLLKNLEDKMDIAAMNFEFEKAAELRDEVETLRGKWGI